MDVEEKQNLLIHFNEKKKYIIILTLPAVSVKQCEVKRKIDNDDGHFASSAQNYLCRSVIIINQSN